MIDTCNKSSVKRNTYSNQVLLILSKQKKKQKTSITHAITQVLSMQYTKVLLILSTKKKTSVTHAITQML